jgi:hypothetical protein
VINTEVIEFKENIMPKKQSTKAIKAALAAVKKADLDTEILEASNREAYQHGWNDHAASIKEIAQSNIIEAEPVSQSWWDRLVKWPN